MRGMHYQDSPLRRDKLVRCTKGSIYDVVVDLRPQSPTFKDWIGVALTAANRNMVYVPEGCAHGFLTLEDESEVFYQMSEFYHPESARGVRWDDPAFQIVWPGKAGSDFRSGPDASRTSNQCNDLLKEFEAEGSARDRPSNCTASRRSFIPFAGALPAMEFGRL